MNIFSPPTLILPEAQGQDYALLDSGDGYKWEQFGPYSFVRPEPQALWRPQRSRADWEAAEGFFQGADAEDRGRWQLHPDLPPRWPLQRGPLRFWVEPTPFRHFGVFPEQATHWDWMVERVRGASRPLNVLNLFGYTGVASLAVAQAGAQVTHVDASKKVIAWARENQTLSELDDRPIRWLVDDALKFVQREARRGSQYDGLIIDPPKFGRGPKGEVWKLDEQLPTLLDACRELLSPQPVFVVLTAYAIRASALSLGYALADMCAEYGGSVEAGEMVLVEASAERRLSTAIFARWSKE